VLAEPPVKRVVAFFDGQNLFHGARDAFGYRYPNFDPLKLAQHACGAKGWTLAEARFYTGVPDAVDNPFWHHFWASKLAQMGAFPSSPTSRNTRGINGSDWIRIDRAAYDACLDSRDYRPKGKP
jgi:hypothetical protein